MKDKIRAFWKFASPFLDRTTLDGRAAVAQMADDVRLLAANSDGVTEDDLLIIGWPRRSIERHAAKARERAVSLSAG